jgi:hypothetical protein
MPRYRHESGLKFVVGLLIVIAVGGSLAGGVRAADDRWSSPPPVHGGKIVFQAASAQGDDPTAAGKAAAESLRELMGAAPLRVVIVSECFEDRQNKEKVLAGVRAVLPAAIIVGQSTYGSFTQAGCCDADSVCLLGLGGEGVGLSAALVTNMGAAKLSLDTHQAIIQSQLHAAGAKLAGILPRTAQDRLLILLADAHSPKNQFLVEGAQQVLGPQFPITGGSANKNAGQTLIYFQGQAYTDSAVALMLSGDFQVSLAGRQAKDNDAVIRTARQCAAEALGKAPLAAAGEPIAALAFDCAGRRNKLHRIADELAAIQSVTGRELPLFGCYCAGEIGPVDTSDKSTAVLSGGSGWHVMFTVLRNRRP